MQQLYHVIKGFFCLFCFYRRFLENKKQKLKINDKTNYLWTEYVYTEKLKGEKQIWRQILHEASLEKIQRINIYWEKKTPNTNIAYID